jgi:hypothetical protein
MKHDMTTPCNNCPFRTDVKPYIRPERVIEIRDTMMKDQSSFPCHKTTDLDEDTQERLNTSGEQQCAGALIILEKNGGSTQLMRISERLGMYDRTKLDMDAPVYATFADMVKAHRPKKKRKKKSKGPPGGEAIWEWVTEQGGTASFVDAAEHFGCTTVEIENCMDDELPEHAEGLDEIAGYMGPMGAVAYDDDEREIEAY